MIIEFFSIIWVWLKARWAERSTWDGGVIIIFGIVALAASQLMPYAAWAAIAYGVWTLVKGESTAG